MGATGEHGIRRRFREPRQEVGLALVDEHGGLPHAEDRRRVRELRALADVPLRGWAAVATTASPSPGYFVAAGRAQSCQHSTVEAAHERGVDDGREGAIVVPPLDDEGERIGSTSA